MSLRESLSYTPVALSFGTSGLRGLVNDMTDLECYINTAGFLRFVAKTEGLVSGSTIYFAGDLRDSTPRIMAAVQAAIQDAGYVAVQCGKIPTPALAYIAAQHQAAAIMVTGSHIPSDRNGIKFYKRSGEVLKRDEAGIQAAVAAVRAEIYESEDSIFMDTGSLKQLPGLLPTESMAEDMYRKRYLDVFSANTFVGKKLVVYQHSAVGRDLLVDLFKSMGAEVIAADRSEQFVPIDTENVTEADKARFAGFAQKYPGIFAVISTDGDSDRPFVIDENGTFYRGDVLGCVVTEFLGAKSVAVPVSSNDAVDAFCQNYGLELAHTKIGSPFVIEAMEVAQAKPAVGWEVNGGFLLGDDMSLNDAVLKALPTRDAVLPVICSLLLAMQKGQKVSELFAGLPARYTGGALIDDIPVDQITRFKEISSDKEIMQELAQKVFGETDLGALASLDTTDGLRLRFESGDVVHLRPSGNAPQFRVYTNADSQERADALAQNAISDGGYIPLLLASLA